MGIFPAAQGSSLRSLWSDLAIFQTHPRLNGSPRYGQENRGTRAATTFPHNNPIFCHGNQIYDPIWPKTLMQLSPF